MKLTPVPYEAIGNGTKTIELRLNDEKRQKLSEGDTVFFLHTQEERFLDCTVGKLYFFASFRELYGSLDLRACGYRAEQTARPEDMRAYYTEDEEKRCGVVGIELRNVREVAFEATNDVASLSALATRLLKAYYDDIIGAEQNDYMLKKFQSVEGIREQLAHGYRYFFVTVNGERKGFFAYCERGNELYLSKFYFDASIRGKGYGNRVVDFLKREGVRLHKETLTLNVNKYNPTVAVYENMGFVRLRAEVNDIGEGYVMDDFVYGMNLCE